MLNELNWVDRRRIDRRIQRYSSISTKHDCVIWTAGCDGGNGLSPRLCFTKDGKEFGIRICRYILERKLDRSLNVGMLALHTCDNINGPCINEDHLYEGTPKQNGEDKRNRSRSATGSRHGMSVLSEETVKQIKIALRKDTRYGAGRSLARKYNVSDTTISNIKKGLNWIHVKI